jgi:hypothetical protein
MGQLPTLRQQSLPSKFIPMSYPVQLVQLVQWQEPMRHHNKVSHQKEPREGMAASQPIAEPGTVG